MTLKQYIENLQKLAQERPEALEMEVVTSVDDEGNGYNPVHCSPCMGVYEDKDFIAEAIIECWNRSKENLNAVCVN